MINDRQQARNIRAIPSQKNVIDKNKAGQRI